VDEDEGDQLEREPLQGRIPGAGGCRGVVEAEALLAALPDRDRALWATAMFAGLRLGELQALRVESIDLASGVVRIERGWDAKEGEIEPKSAAARRRVPIPAVLRDYLLDHLMATRRTGADLAFGRTESSPFDRPRCSTAPTRYGAPPGLSA